MTTFRITGIKNYQKTLFHNYFLNSQNNQDLLVSRALEYRKNIENLCFQENLNRDHLSLQSKTAMLNIKGLISFHRNEPHKYNEIFQIIEKSKAKYSKLNGLICILQFSATTKILHKLSRQNCCVYVNLSYQTRSFSSEYFAALINVLFCKISGRKISSEQKAILLFEEEKFNSVNRPTGVQNKNLHQPAGKAYNLDKLFTKLNKEYFSNRIKKPALRFSKNKTYRKLGSFNNATNSIDISKTLDDKRVPSYVIEHVLYHEILHIIYPVKIKNGRSIKHSPAFKQEERKYRFHNEANKWLETEFSKLWHQSDRTSKRGRKFFKF